MIKTQCVLQVSLEEKALSILTRQFFESRVLMVIVFPCSEIGMVTRRDCKVITFTRSHVKNNSKLTNLMI